MHKTDVEMEEKTKTDMYKQHVTLRKTKIRALRKTKGDAVSVISHIMIG